MKVSGSSEFCGWNGEMNVTNDGKLKFKNSWNGVMNRLGVDENKETTLTADGSCTAAAGLDMGVGVKHAGKDHHIWFRSQLNNNPTFNLKTVWRPVDWLVIGDAAEFNKDIKGAKLENRYNIAFPGTTGY